MTSPSRMTFACMSSTHTTLSIFYSISFMLKIEKIILSLRGGGLCLGRIHLEFTWSFHALLLYLLIYSLMHKYLPQMAPIVWTQFVVQIDSALTQWAQDNKFVKSGLENWVLVNSSYHLTSSKTISLNKWEKILGPRSFIFISINIFHMQLLISFLSFVLWFFPIPFS